MATIEQKQEVLSKINELTKKAHNIAKKYNLPYVSLTVINKNTRTSAFTDFHLNSRAKHLQSEFIIETKKGG